MGLLSTEVGDHSGIVSTVSFCSFMFLQLDAANDPLSNTLWEYSSVVEHGIADPAVTGSTPVAPCF